MTAATMIPVDDPFPQSGGGGCSNPLCVCHDPHLPCEEWAGVAETGRWCPCCGWNLAAHHRPNRKACVDCQGRAGASGMVGEVCTICAGRREREARRG